MHPAIGGHGPPGRDQRLPGHLPAEHADGAVRRADPAEQVHLELLQVEQLHEAVEGVLAAGDAVDGELGLGMAHAGQSVTPKISTHSRSVSDGSLGSGWLRPVGANPARA